MIRYSLLFGWIVFVLAGSIWGWLGWRNRGKPKINPQLVTIEMANEAFEKRDYDFAAELGEALLTVELGEAEKIPVLYDTGALTTCGATMSGPSTCFKV